MSKARIRDYSNIDYRAFELQLRKQICDEIREKAEAFGSGVSGQLGYIVTLLLLDQIEQGEEVC